MKLSRIPAIQYGTGLAAMPTLYMMELRCAIGLINWRAPVWELHHITEHWRIAGDKDRKIFVGQVDAEKLETASADEAIAFVLDLHPEAILGRVWTIPHFQHFYRSFKRNV